jgi:hypothetical protein
MAVSRPTPPRTDRGAPQRARAGFARALAQRPRLVLAAGPLLVLITLAGCANTLQNQPLHDRDLESAAVNTNFPIYWLGRAFEGYSVSSVTQDNNGGFGVAYGDCVIGGQAVCVTPLLIVTSPDNSFVPGAGPTHPVTIRGRRATVSQDGTTMAIPTGAVVVSVFARSPAVALAAARSLLPINESGAPLSGPLPAPGRNSGYARTPLGGPTPLFIVPPAAGVSGDANAPPPPAH